MIETTPRRYRNGMLAAVGLIGAMGLGAPVAGASAANMLLILDGSNSMWGQVDGVAKIETAKSVLGGLLRDLPADTRVGFMAYGHTEDGTCEDVRMVSDIGSEGADAVIAKIDAITPRGKTPIAKALRQSEAAFEKFVDEPNYVVLISDGIETCLGDPCAAAGDLVAKGLDVKVHVVGFDVSADEREQLECIADAGHGRYFHASSTDGFRQAVEEVRQVAVAAPPPPVQLAQGPYFLDEFEGGELQGHWEVLNENPDAYIVEDGKLLIVATGSAALAKGNVENMLRLTQPMPKGDWVATVKFSMNYQTGREAPFLALYDDGENLMAAYSSSWSYYGGVSGARLYIAGEKVTKGKKTSFSQVIWGGASGVAFDEESAPNPFLIRITKKGRVYTPAVLLEGVDGAKWVEHESFTVLRQKGNLAVGILQQENVKGETTMFVDWVKIEAK